MTLGLLVLGVVVLLALKVPVAFALLVPSMVYITLSDGMTMEVVFQRVFAGVNSFPLVAVPLFIMTGYLANASGAADRLFDLISKLFARVRGNLAYVNIYTSLGFSWMSGAAVADAAGLGAIMVPAMKKRGYPAGFTLGLTGASAAVGPIMPPSIPAIIYAVSAGVSIGGLFAAGVLPAIMIALILTVWVMVRMWSTGWQSEDREFVPVRQVLRAGVTTLPVLLTPVVILGGILGGIFTPTEAAAAGAGWLILLGVFLYRTLSIRRLNGVFVQTARTTATILIIAATSNVFGYVLARERAPQAMADALLSISENPIVLILLINLVLLLVGTVLETVSALLIMVPVILPIGLELGLHPLQLGILMVLNLTIGLLTPPIGLVLYVLSSVTETRFAEVWRGVVPFLAPLLISLLLISFVAPITLWLPEQLGMMR